LYENGVNIQALRGHRSAINSVLKITAPGEVLTSVHLTDLIKSFGIERPTTRRFFPTWDLARVLRSLLHPPYEPLHDAPLALLTQKTVFLLALASGSRRGEIAAWSRAPRHVQFADRLSAVSLLPSVEFRAKTQKPHEASRPVEIPALSIAGSEIERLQCPVRALKIYLKRTEPLFKKEDKPLIFKPYIGKSANVKPAHISNWLVRVIRRAYDQEDDQVDQNFRATAHDIRALSTSWAATNGVPMNEILSAASWRSATVFTSHYLKDMCHQSAALHTIGPVVAARSVV
jgi:integrase